VRMATNQSGTALIAVMSSAAAPSFHWVRYREGEERWQVKRAVCGARPGGWIAGWSLADGEGETPIPAYPGGWRYAPQVPPCRRCEGK
jgi:hypothetical protein